MSCSIANRCLTQWTRIQSKVKLYNSKPNSTSNSTPNPNKQSSYFPLIDKLYDYNCANNQEFGASKHNEKISKSVQRLHNLWHEYMICNKHDSSCRISGRYKSSRRFKEKEALHEVLKSKYEEQMKKIQSFYSYTFISSDRMNPCNSFVIRKRKISHLPSSERSTNSNQIAASRKSNGQGICIDMDTGKMIPNPKGHSHYVKHHDMYRTMNHAGISKTQTQFRQDAIHWPSSYPFNFLRCIPSLLPYLQIRSSNLAVNQQRKFHVSTLNYFMITPFQQRDPLSNALFNELDDLIGKIYKEEDLKLMQDKYTSLKEKIESPEFYKDANRTEVMIEYTNLQNKIEMYEHLVTEIKNGREMFSLVKEEEDQDMLQELEEQMFELHNKLLEKEFESLMSGESDKKDCFVEIHAGAGGTESCDWVTMLKDMYINWGKTMDFKVSVQSETKGLVAGLKSCLLKIEGEYAYGWMRTESGVHRLVRISPFDASQRRHTSFAEVYAFPCIDDSIRIEINPSDLVFETMRASGAGGQHVNKTDSAVRVTHIPTGISVRSQEEREQGRNKQNALRILTAKLYQLEEQKRRETLSEKGKERPNVSFGQQIRSYVLHPYKAIKDTRTNFQSSNPEYVFSGEGLTEFMKEALKKGI